MKSSTALLLLLLLLPISTYSHSSSTAAIGLYCRSNATHIAWVSYQRHAHTDHNSDVIRVDRLRKMMSEESLAKPYDKPRCALMTRKQAEQDCLTYLRQNAMAFDKLQFETLGFGGDDDEGGDGLGNGLVGPTVQLALDAKVQYPWTDELPKQIFLEYVLNFANLNEARTNWRPLLVDAIQPLMEASSPSNVSEVVRVLNTHLWTTLARTNNSSIVFKPSQTPLIFDPMSVIAFGYASCTGLAILFADALRAAGVAARVAGTPAWKGKRESGNHNWVEVLDDNHVWKFMEPSPAQKIVDNLERDPCQRWFCIPDRYPASLVYAARLDQTLAGNTFFRLAWEWNSTDVPGIDRTEFYSDVCNKCTKGNDPELLEDVPNKYHR